jgi:hypothetical protein
MFLATNSPVRQSPTSWAAWQPALFPGQADPWPVLWAAGKKAAINQDGIAYGYKGLALGIFYQAVLDAQERSFEGSEARQWLAESGLELLTLLGVGVQPGVYREWVSSGCKAHRWVRLWE